jgi:ankyrin repeat protein
MARPLYYAASVGVSGAVQQILVDAGAEIDAQGGYYGNALQVASHRGYEKVVQLLLGAGADVNAQGGFYGNALQAASYRGGEKVVQMLLDAGAKIIKGNIESSEDSDVDW